MLGVLTAKDVPNNKVGHIQQDWDVMIAEGDITRMIGDTICVVVAETEEILEKAKKLVKVDYEKRSRSAMSMRRWQRMPHRFIQVETYASSVTLQEEMQKLL